MPDSTRQRHRPAPLSILVLQAETEVMLRRRRVKSRISTIGQELRTQLASPTMLLMAGGVGFAAGILTRPRAAKVNIEQPQGAPPKRPLATLLKLLGIVRTLANILPSAPGSSVPSANWTTIDTDARIARPPPLH